jgi:hypothetical protein
MTLICGFSAEPLRHFTLDSFFTPGSRSGRGPDSWAKSIARKARSRQG